MEVNYDYAKLPRERITECLREYIDDDTYDDKKAYEEILACARELVESVSYTHLRAHET